mmetsp:Transcript_67838/g.102314  ORF Transcript_67838/g.102314 Transcript_67838/m.102314 type:complete len:122 (-) Transcript_67838:264-629(-)
MTMRHSNNYNVSEYTWDHNRLMKLMTKAKEKVAQRQRDDEQGKQLDEPSDGKQLEPPAKRYNEEPPCTKAPTIPSAPSRKTPKGAQKKKVQNVDEYGSWCPHKSALGLSKKKPVKYRQPMT